MSYGLYSYGLYGCGLYEAADSECYLFESCRNVGYKHGWITFPRAAAVERADTEVERGTYPSAEPGLNCSVCEAGQRHNYIGHNYLGRSHVGHNCLRCARRGSATMTLAPVCPARPGTSLPERGLYLGIADGMSIARVWACRHSK